jgi:hypothetical protein
MDGQILKRGHELKTVLRVFDKKRIRVVWCKAVKSLSEWLKYLLFATLPVSNSKQSGLHV